MAIKAEMAVKAWLGENFSGEKLMPFFCIKGRHRKNFLEKILRLFSRLKRKHEKPFWETHTHKIHITRSGMKELVAGSGMEMWQLVVRMNIMYDDCACVHNSADDGRDLSYDFLFKDEAEKEKAKEWLDSIRVIARLRG